MFLGPVARKNISVIKLPTTSCPGGFFILVDVSTAKFRKPTSDPYTIRKHMTLSFDHVLILLLNLLILLYICRPQDVDQGFPKWGDFSKLGGENS